MEPIIAYSGMTPAFVWTTFASFLVICCDVERITTPACVIICSIPYLHCLPGPGLDGQTGAKPQK